MADDAITGRSAVQSAWRDALMGLDGSHRQVTLVDADFAHWPLGEAPLLEHLGQWLRLPGRQLRLMALDFATTERAHPRLARWRRDWAHAMVCLSPSDTAGLDWPCVLLAGTLTVQGLDLVHWRAKQVGDAADRLILHHQIDALAQRCEPAWPVTTLGL